MRCAKLALAIVLFVFSGCECDSELQRVCPAPVECWVEQDVENNEANLIKSDFPWYATEGACSLGTTACDAEGFVYCEGVQYPEDEICDFEDNDCDEETDEGFDEDRDGVSVCAGDCNDLDPNRYPGNSEQCDGVDNNCDGHIPPEEYTDADGDGVIACNDCDDNNSNVYPGALEMCDLIDNNCNGIVDENVAEAWDGCGPPTTLGACEQDIGVCINGEMYCPNAVYESAEGCDNIDNDCDGQIDEDLIQECYSECGVGIEYCSQGNWIGCNAPQPGVEVCGDSIDNDCDGEIDEGCLCVPGTLSLCAQNVVDDEGNSLNCGTGIQECLPNGTYGPCVWALNQPESCNNYDDDCDGVVDGMVQACGESQYAGIGECKLGTETCVEGIWTECEGSVEPVEEFCDELDNDCDGEIDENLNSHEKVDMVFMIDGSGSMCQYVNAIAGGLGQYASDFEESEHRFALVMFPFEMNQTTGNIPWVVITDLVDVNQFIAVLSSIVCSYPGSEPSYDTMHDLADNSNPAGISWRGDAYPYLILMTDEPAQTWMGYTESDVAANTADCQVGECDPGDPYEVFVFAPPYSFTSWDEIVFGESDRLIPIAPADENEYANKLRGVFTNVCL